MHVCWYPWYPLMLLFLDGHICLFRHFAYYLCEPHLHCVLCGLFSGPLRCIVWPVFAFFGKSFRLQLFRRFTDASDSQGCHVLTAKCRHRRAKSSHKLAQPIKSERYLNTILSCYCSTDHFTERMRVKADPIITIITVFTLALWHC